MPAPLFISNISYAFAPNPSATCPDGFAQSSLTNNDYNNKDTLIKKGVNNASVATTLFNNATRTDRPALPVGFTDTLRDSDNDIIETASFDLPARTSRSFYINARYGSTQAP